MSESIFKTSRRNTFTFEGHAIVNDNSFTINKTNEAGTWVFNSLNIGVDCGDHGINYVNLMGGYNPKGGSYITIQKVDSKGLILPKEDNITVDWEDRLDFDVTAEDINKTNFVEVTLEKDGNGKNIQKSFIASYDAVAYIKEFITDKLPIVVRGHIDYRLNGAGDEWIASHIVDSIQIKNEEFLQPKAILNLMVLVDKNTLGKPNIEEKNVPLFVKTAFYIYKINKDVYKQTCAIPIKILFDLTSVDINDEEQKKKFTYGVEHFFSPEKGKKEFTSEILFRCHYSGGVKKTEINLEDLPKDIREGIENGFISKEQVMGSMAIQGPQNKDIIFDSVVTRVETIENEDGSSYTVPKVIAEFSKYKNSEVVMFEDLEPIETTTSTSVAVDNTMKIDDEEIDQSAADIMALFSAMGN